jgi:hypothetical protein
MYLGRRGRQDLISAGLAIYLTLTVSLFLITKIYICKLDIATAAARQRGERPLPPSREQHIVGENSYVRQRKQTERYKMLFLDDCQENNGCVFFLSFLLLGCAKENAFYREK